MDNEAEAVPGVDTSRRFGIPRTGCAAPNVWTAVTGYGRASRPGEQVHLVGVVPRPTSIGLRSPVGCQGAPVDSEWLPAMFGGVAALPAWQAQYRAPCHTLPGRVGERRGVNRAYDLAESRFADDNVVGKRATEQNKRMQQTRGGWRRVEAWWSAIPRLAAIAGGGKVVRPSQLIRGVRPT